MKKFCRIRIPEQIAQVIEAHLPEFSTPSVEAYVESVLREHLCAKGYFSAFTPEEEREVEQRLRDLGYLD